jgi:lysozyme family protein
MKTIAEMIDDVIRREGGYANHPKDRGGPTKYGITAKTLGDWRGLKRAATAKQVEALTVSEARSIYLNRYYLRPEIDKLPESIQPFIFDAAVNHGPKEAIEMVQEVCLKSGYDPGPIDGIIGPRTIDAAERFARVFLDRLIDQREHVYRTLVVRDPSQEVFLAGWFNRLDEFRA